MSTCLRYVSLAASSLCIDGDNGVGTPLACTWRDSKFSDFFWGRCLNYSLWGCRKMTPSEGPQGLPQLLQYRLQREKLSRRHLCKNWTRPKLQTVPTIPAFPVRSWRWGWEWRTQSGRSSFLGTVNWGRGIRKDEAFQDQMALTPAPDQDAWRLQRGRASPGAGCGPSSRRTLATARSNVCRGGRSAAGAERGRRGGARPKGRSRDDRRGAGRE